MDPFTAIGLAFSFGAQITDELSSGADPTRSAIFETYQSISQLHARVGNIEDMLLEVHTKIGQLPEDVRRMLLDQSAREAEIQLWSRIMEQRSDHRAMAASLDADPDGARQRYLAESRVNMDDIGVEIFNLIQSGPFSLEMAVLATGMEGSIAATLGEPFPAIRERVDNKLRQIESKLDGVVAAHIESAETRLTQIAQDITTHFGGDDWLAGGLDFQAAYSALVEGTNILYGTVEAACVMIDRDDGPYDTALPRYTLLQPGTMTYEVAQIYRNDRDFSDVGLCGQADALGVETYVGETSTRKRREASLRNVARLREAGVLVTKSVPLARQRWDAFLGWKKKLDGQLSSFNHAADLLDLLRAYEASVRSGVATLRDRVEIIAHGPRDQEADMNLLVAIEGIERFAVGGAIDALQALEGEATGERDRRFREQFARVAEEAERSVQAGIRRHEMVLEQFESDARYKELGGYFRFLSRMAHTMKALDKALSRMPVSAGTDADNRPPDGEGVDGAGGRDPAASEAEPAMAGDGKTPEGAATPDQPGTNAERHLRAEKILRELKVLGAPTGDPSITPVTRQEELIVELSGILKGWEMTEADRAYLAQSRDRAQAIGTIAADLAFGSKINAFKTALVEALKPARLGDGTTQSISMARTHAHELDRRIEEVMNWRFPALKAPARMQEWLREPPPIGPSIGPRDN